MYLVLERGRERGKDECVVASRAPPYWGPGLRPRQVP